jgi:hypothetical protein
MLTTAKYRRRRRDQQESNREQTDSIDAADKPTAKHEVTPMRAKLIDEAMAAQPDIPPTVFAPRALPLAARAEQMSFVAQTEHDGIASASPTAKRRNTRKRSDATRAGVHPSRRWSLLALLPFVIALLCFAPRIARMWSETEGNAIRESSIVSQQTEQPRFLTKPIEEIRPGDRVLAYNPEVTDEQRAAAIEPDPATWRLIEMELVAEDGRRVDIRLLRPFDWINQQGAVPGGQIHLNMKEIGAVGYAGVLKISACPDIRKGNGRVVTGVFQHVADNLVEVHIEGQLEPIISTSGHPFWSEDRKAFVSAMDLPSGELLRTADNRMMAVQYISVRTKSESVFNVEVDIEHVYYVGRDGVLVHNVKSCTTTDDDDLFTMLPAHQQATKARIIEEHPGLHPDLATKAARGSVEAVGKGGQGADIKLVNGGGREVTIHNGSLDSVGAHLIREAGQRGTTEIWVQIDTPGASQNKTISLIQGTRSLRSAHPELRGKEVRFFGPDGRQWWSGKFK